MTWQVDVENVAGILDGTATVEPGLNAVRASNWQGKSSFVAALELALGIGRPLTEGKDAGRVHLRTPDRDLTVALHREGDGIHRTGEPYLDDEYDAVRAELFACLDEDNAVRRAVRAGENLESVLLSPLDFQNIDERIADLERERDRIGDELEQARTAAGRLPAVQEQVTRLESELDDLRETRDSLTDDTGDESADSSAQSELAGARSRRERAENRIERLEATIERTEDALETKRRELDEVEVEDADAIEAELATARERRQSVQRDVEVLQSVYSATGLVLSEDRIDLVTDVQRELTGDTVTCWTCGEDVSRETVETRLDELGERIARLRASAESHRESVEHLEARREEVVQARQRERDLEDEIADLEATLADHRESLSEARDRYRQAAERVERLSESVDETMSEVTDVESEIKYREAELEDARDELDALERRADRIESLESELDAITDEIADLRDRKDRITREAREAFDEAMGDILDRFDTGFETARLTADFDLVVARNGREASLDALSKGELELLGFVAALAGHRSFDVGETVPLLLVDGVGDLADENLHTLVDYLRERTEYLVFTVYPEYAPFEGKEIDPGDWTIAVADSG